MLNSINHSTIKNKSPENHLDYYREIDRGLSTQGRARTGTSEDIGV